MGKKPWDEKSLEELEQEKAYWGGLLYTPTKRHKFGSLFTKEEHLRKSLGEEFLEEFEEGGDEEEVLEKFIRKGTRQPGANKKSVKSYLLRTLKEAREEGRV